MAISRPPPLPYRRVSKVCLMHPGTILPLILQHNYLILELAALLPGWKWTICNIFFAQYWYLVSFMTHNICVWYPWYTIFWSNNHDAQHLCLDPWHTMPIVSMRDNIYVWYPWYTIFMAGIHDTNFLFLVSTMYNIYIWIHDTSRTEKTSLSRVVRNGGDPCSAPLSGWKKSPRVESSTWPLNSHNCSENYNKTKTK